MDRPSASSERWMAANRPCAEALRVNGSGVETMNCQAPARVWQPAQSWLAAWLTFCALRWMLVPAMVMIWNDSAIERQGEAALQS